MLNPKVRLESFGGMRKNRIAAPPPTSFRISHTGGGGVGPQRLLPLRPHRRAAPRRCTHVF